MAEICFILVAPKVPENVGAAARALKTMGYQDLRIVASRVHTDDKARWLAHGAADVLGDIRTCESLDDALLGCDFVIGTTARFRNRRTAYHPPEDLVKVVHAKRGMINRVALVFGCEESGLSNADLDRCDVTSSIPLKTRHPSLNLAQAVMLYAYELSRADRGKKGVRVPGKNEASQQALMKQKSLWLLDHLRIRSSTPLYRKLQERLALLQGRDIGLAHLLLDRIRARLTKGEAEDPLSES